MPNTYTQIHFHCVFCPRYREALITPDWAERLHKYITGIIQNHDHKMLAINTMPDHLHMLFGMRPNIKYIRNQQEHHKKITWNAEYISLLKEHEIDFDHRYLFFDPI